jgi:hypothetical protein
MDKNKIKNQLKRTFLSEEKVPGVDETEKAQKESGKENKKALNDIEKKMGEYDKAATKEDKKSEEATQKFNTTEKEAKYHDEVEIMNGQEMVEYDREPSERFKDRAEQAIAGDPTMGNSSDYANVIPKQQGFSGPDFGKKLVEKIRASKKQRDEEDEKWNGMGDVAIPRGKNKNPRKIAVEGEETKEIMEEKPPKARPKKPTDAEVKAGADAWYASHEKPEKTKHVKPDNPELDENVEECSEGCEEIKESKKSKMKRLNFKKPFNGVGNALQLIPESYREDKKEFEMTDGNENYRIRWEGSLNEGRAVVLMASDKTLVNEDMNHMKHRMGYKSEDTLGTLKGSERINENDSFNDVFNKTKKLLSESEEEKEVINENAIASSSMGFANEGNLEEEETIAEEEVTEETVTEEEVNETEKDRFDEIFEGYDEEVNEELSPEQSKEMDTDNDGDIDGKDLENLRKKKVTEELSEISQATALRAKDKARTKSLSADPLSKDKLSQQDKQFGEYGLKPLNDKRVDGDPYASFESYGDEIVTLKLYDHRSGDADHIRITKDDYKIAKSNGLISNVSEPFHRALIRTIKLTQQEMGGPEGIEEKVEDI